MRDASAVESGRQSRWRRGPRLRMALISIDLLAVLGAWLGMFLVCGYFAHVPRPAVVTSLVVATLAVLLAAHWDLYLSRVSTVRPAELAALLRVSTVSALAGWATFHMLGSDLWWAVALLTGIVTFLLLAATRTGFDTWIKGRRRSGAYCRRILLVGRDSAAAELVELVEDQPELGYRIVGYVGPPIPAGDPFSIDRVADYGDLTARSRVKASTVSSSPPPRSPTTVSDRSCVTWSRPVCTSSSRPACRVSITGVSTRPRLATSLFSTSSGRRRRRGIDLAEHAMDIVGARRAAARSTSVLGGRCPLDQAPRPRAGAVPADAHR